MPKPSAELPHRVIVLPWLRALMRRFVLPNWNAITIRSWIFAWRPLDDAELAHEMVHVRQWRENGFLMFIVRYLAASRSASKAGGNRYSDNPFEAEARQVEDSVRARHKSS